MRSLCTVVPLALALGLLLLVGVGFADSAALVRGSRSGSSDRFQVEEATEAEQVLQVVGQMGGAVTDLAADDNHVYVAIGPRIAVLEGGTGEEPRLVGLGPVLDDVVRGITLAGDHLVAAAGLGGLYVLDLATPSEPKVVGRLATDGRALHVAASGFTAYAAAGQALLVVDISQPSDPLEVASLPLPYHTELEHRLVADNSRVYYSAGRAGLGVIDVANPEEPEVLDWEETNVWSVAASEDVAYVLEITTEVDPATGGTISEQYLSVLQVETDSGVTEVGNLRMPIHETYDAIAASGSHVYLSNSGDLFVIGVSDPADPIALSHIDVPVTPLHYHPSRRMSVLDSHLFLTVNAAIEHGSGVAVVDVADAENPHEIGQWLWDAPADFTRLVVTQPYVLLAEKQFGVRILDVAEPSVPIQVGAIHQYKWDTGIQDFTASAGFAFVVAARDEVHLADMRDPVNTKLLDMAYVSSPMSAGSTGGRAFIGTFDSSGEGAELVVVEAAADDTLVRLGQLRIGGGCRSVTDVAVNGEYAYLACLGRPHSLAIVDVRDPASASLVSQLPLTRLPEGVAVDRGHAYVASTFPSPTEVRSQDPTPPYRGFTIVDVSDNTNPQVAGTFSVQVDAASYENHGRPWRIAAAGDYVFLPTRDCLLRVINVQDPSEPTQVQQLHVPGVAYGAVVSSDHVYLSARQGGLVIYRILQPLPTPTFGTPWPSPTPTSPSSTRTPGSTYTPTATTAADTPPASRSPVATETATPTWTEPIPPPHTATHTSTPGTAPTSTPTLDQQRSLLFLPLLSQQQP